MAASKPRLLVVDDEESFADLVAVFGLRCGFEVDVLSNAVGLRDSQVASVDVMMLDLCMPQIDGIEVLRRFEGLPRKPRLVLASGLDRRTLTGAREFARRVGFVVAGELSKPVRGDAIEALLVRIRAEVGSGAQAPAVAKRRVVPTLSLDEIAGGIQRREFVVHFQPQLGLPDGHWSGVEALVRWQHPVHGLLYPDAFIELVEASDLALPFTLAVVESALAGVRELAADAGFTGLLAVNMPPSALTDVGFPEAIDAMLVDAGFPHSRFVVEITETSLPPSLSISTEIEVRLRLHGVQLSIDDFGTGYSSLERLGRVPFSELKIDLLFVKRAEQDPAARAVIRYAVQLGHSLGMKVVAEGVEDAWTERWLASTGCDVAQGYAISRPLPAGALVRWWHERQGTVRALPGTEPSTAVESGTAAPAESGAKERVS